MQHLLYLTHRIPYPPNKGDKVRSYHLLEFLRTRYHVHLGTFVDAEEDWRHVDAVKKLCGETYFARLNPTRAKLKSLAGLWRGEALTLAYYRDAGLQRWVNGLLARQQVKFALVFSSSMAQYVANANNLRRVADFVDVDSDKWAQYAGSKPWPLSVLYRREAAQLLRQERAIARAFDATVLVTRAEAELFRKLAPESADKISFAANGVDTDYFSPEANFDNPYPLDEQVLVFTGAMDYWPNIDAVEWFAKEVFPAVLVQHPAARFYIVGAHPAPAVMKLSSLAGVRVTGAVPDIRPYLAHAKLAVAPLRLARGVQNKVLEAMAMGKPTVVSPHAAAGVEATPGAELLVAAGPEEFANQIDALLLGRHPGLGAAARQRVLTDYRWETNLSRIDRLLKGLHAAPSAEPAAAPGIAAAERWPAKPNHPDLTSL